jgi:CheY-like chemotaxis protein
MSSGLGRANERDPVDDLPINPGHATKQRLDGMGVSHHLRANIAGLRRFARILTGRQRFANLCVVRLIDAVATSPDIMSRESTPKVALFKFLLSIINDPDTAGESGVRQIVKTSQSFRQAYLLAEVERLAPRAVAEILGATAEHVTDVLAQSARAERAFVPARILVIEDEPLISWQIEDLVTQLGHEILGVATTRKQTAKFLRATRPDIVLADVQLADGSTGIDSVTDVLSHINVPAIFITANPDRLSSGHLVEPVFVVAKPFVPAALKAMISQALFLAANHEQG